MKDLMLNKTLKPLLLLTVVGGSLAGLTQDAHALLTFTPGTSAAAFSASVTGAGYGTIGSPETFEESTVGTGPANVQPLTDPLTQTTPNNTFAAGLSQPMTVRADMNTGAAADIPNPRPGAGAMVVEGAQNPDGSASSTQSKAVFTATGSDSLDYIFSPAINVGAVGFNPLAFNNVATIRVYDTTGALFMNGAFGPTAANLNSTSYLGIQATGAQRIGRINVFSNGGALTGGDNFSLFSAPAAVAAPEPSTWVMMFLGLGCIGISGWRKKRLRPMSAAC